VAVVPFVIGFMIMELGGVGAMDGWERVGAAVKMRAVGCAAVALGGGSGYGGRAGRQGQRQLFDRQQRRNAGR
jgi:hypothetical protein